MTASVDALAGFGGPGTTDESCRQRPRPQQDIPIVSAGLLSARFPLVSPSGVLIRCVQQENGSMLAGRTYAVDGGYAENSGLQTLLELRQFLQNEIAESRLPVDVHIVVLDNHYISTATSRPERRPRELTAPLATIFNARLSQGALEQGALWSTSNSGTGNNTYTVLSPRVRPSVAAPLGWVLSPETQEDLSLQSDLNWGCPSSTLIDTSGRPTATELLKRLGLVQYARGTPGQSQHDASGVCNS